MGFDISNKVKIIFVLRFGYPIILTNKPHIFNEMQGGEYQAFIQTTWYPGSLFEEAKTLVRAGHVSRRLCVVN